MITHYVSDYFTFPHNANYPGNLKDHCIYEEELKKVAALCVKYDRSLTVHPRAESKVSMAYPQLLGRSHLLRALDELEQRALKLLHSKTGAAVARRVFGVEDAVYDAIWYHTTGKPDMTRLEKIIYLADYIEPSRDFPGVEELRKAVYEDLDHGLLLGLTMTIQEMEEMGNPVHHLTRDARDYLLKRGIR